ncbi:MAG: efflux RND transporter periplasmic adaptor subunit [Candidatus Brennerbacteria bacterium]|nr:efflux RND transporter periplasmic adaptor subunit [Candidatus Brennerbacteria bacterium]
MKNKLKKPALFAIAAFIIFAGAGVLIFYRYSKKPVYNFVAVKQGEIIQEVTATGTTKPSESIMLGFEKNGIIKNVFVSAGDKVKSGQVLAELDSSELKDNFIQAKAELTAEKAKLDSLKRGFRLEEIQIAKTAFEKAQQDLVNDYAGSSDIIRDAYVKTEDAVRNQISQLISFPDINPQLTFSVYDTQIANDIPVKRQKAGAALNSLKNELAGIGAAPTQDELNQLIFNSIIHLSTVLDLLNRLMDALASAVNLSSANLTAYQTSVTAARTTVNTVITNINSRQQKIASQKITVRQSQDELNLKLAGSSAEELRTQEALVEKSEANINSIKTQIAKTVLRSPIDGIITKQEAKTGENSGANSPLITIISERNFEIEANIPEIDIGKIKLGDPVKIVFDAFPSEIFSEKISYIDPAETIIDGIVDYKIKIFLDRPDSRIKSGLTAGLAIETQKKSDVLILPQSAIIEKDSGDFVKIFKNNKEEESSVVLGIRGQNGDIEIISGLNNGQEVINIGVKIKE